jgi:hypothetical protein
MFITCLDRFAFCFIFPSFVLAIHEIVRMNAIINFLFLQF